MISAAILEYVIPLVRLIAAADDMLQGGLEFLSHPSTLSEPFYSIRQSTIPDSLPTIQMMAVDILPSSLPLDASNHFSKALFPYLMSLIREYQGEQDKPAYHEALEKATVANGGKLVEKHAWLGEPLAAWKAGVGATDGMTETSSATTLDSAILADKASKDIGALPDKVLMLGSGMVAGPAVDELCKRSNLELIVGQSFLIQD